jgi:hypothetical protein
LVLANADPVVAIGAWLPPLEPEVIVSVTEGL